MLIFIGRQPIFDRRSKVVAYELLYRTGKDNKYTGDSGDVATERLISNIHNIGLNVLTNNKRAFINFTQNNILKMLPKLLHKDYIVAEILEDVELNEHVIKCCRDIRKRGYKLAIDDYVCGTDISGIIDIIDIIKVDFMLNDMVQREQIVNTFKGKKVKFLAEKVETREDFKLALDMGYDYFQGYYFSRPDVLQGYDIGLTEGSRLALFSELFKDDVDFDKLEKLIRYDTGFSYKLIKYVNSSHFGFKQRISSVRQAITLLGRDELRKWATFICLGGNGHSSEEDERARRAMIRGKFCENICSLISPLKAEQAFLVGIFSLLDEMMGVDMQDVLKELPLEDEIKKALLGEKGFYGSILDIVKNYENMKDYTKEFEQMLSYHKPDKSIDTSVISKMFLKSLQWV